MIPNHRCCWRCGRERPLCHDPIFPDERRNSVCGRCCYERAAIRAYYNTAGTALKVIIPEDDPRVAR